MRLAEIMNETHTTHQELADYLDLSRTTVSHYVSGRREPDIATMIKIAEFFQVSLDYLVGRKDNERPAPRTPKNYVEINDKTIRLYPGDTLRVSLGDKLYTFTVQELEI